MALKKDAYQWILLLITLATITFIHGYKYNFVHTLDRWIRHQLKYAAILAFVRSRA